MTARQPRRLPDIGTRVSALLGGHLAYGVVELYEHHTPNQTTFPVKFGSQTKIVTAADVTALPDDQQPPDRKPPQWTGAGRAP